MELPGPGQSEADYVMAETNIELGNTLAWSNSETGNDVNTAAFRVLGDTAFSYNLVNLAGVCNFYSELEIKRFCYCRDEAPLMAFFFLI